MEPLLIYTADSLGRSTCVDGLLLLLFTLACSVCFVGCCRVALRCCAVRVVVLVPLSVVSFHPPAVHKPLGTNRASFEPRQTTRSPPRQPSNRDKNHKNSLTRPDRRLTVEGRLKLDGLTAGHADPSGPLGELSLAPSNLAPYIAGHTLTGLHRPQMLSTSGTA